jgi:pimeloyl-ACP methyl ester carboxylesterase
VDQRRLSGSASARGRDGQEDRARFELIDNAGHWPQWEQFEQFNDLVLRFLAEPN